MRYGIFEVCQNKAPNPKPPALEPKHVDLPSFLKYWLEIYFNRWTRVQLRLVHQENSCLDVVSLFSSQRLRMISGLTVNSSWLGMSLLLSIMVYSLLVRRYTYLPCSCQSHIYQQSTFALNTEKCDCGCTHNVVNHKYTNCMFILYYAVNYMSIYEVNYTYCNRTYYVVNCTYYVIKYTNNVYM